MMRPTSWVHQIIAHTTKGNWPQRVIPGAGPAGSAKVVADFWRADAAHSAAQIVIDVDGSVVCLCDLARIAAYHAEGSNPWSIGIEHYQLADGGVYSATWQAGAILIEFLCEQFSIPTQIPRGPYRNRPLLRMESTTRADGRHNTGGATLVGVFGHRDNTGNRGAGDPGDELFIRLAARGFERVDFDQLEDITKGKDRQAALNARGESLIVDGIVGPSSMAAMRRHGFERWRDVV